MAWIKCIGNSGGEVVIAPIPITSQMVTDSSYLNTNFEGYRAFDNQSCDITTLQYGWLAHSSDNAPTLTVNFGEAKKLGGIFIETANNNNPDTTREVYVEGSSDGSTWENILASGSTVSLVFEVGKYNKYSFNLNEGEYQYFRIRGTQPFFGGSYQYACCFSEIIIYDKSRHGLPEFAETVIATGSSEGVLTFTEDYHDYNLFIIRCTNSYSNNITNLLCSPSLVDSCFLIDSGLVTNEFGNNQYGTYYKDSSTTWTRQGNRNLYISQVIGLTCKNYKIEETEIYNKGSYDTQTRTITGTGLLNYDVLLIATCRDGITPNAGYVNKGYLGKTSIQNYQAVLTAYNYYEKVNITDITMGTHYYHYVSGIKFV